MDLGSDMRHCDISRWRLTLAPRLLTHLQGRFAISMLALFHRYPCAALVFYDMRWKGRCVDQCFQRCFCETVQEMQRLVSSHRPCFSMLCVATADVWLHAFNVAHMTRVMRLRPLSLHLIAQKSCLLDHAVSASLVKQTRRRR